MARSFAAVKAVAASFSSARRMVATLKAEADARSSAVQRIRERAAEPADRRRLALSVDRCHLREGAPEWAHCIGRSDRRFRGQRRDGRREVLGMAIGPSEAETFGTDFLRTLARPGLRGIKLVISDAPKASKLRSQKCCTPHGSAVA